MNVGIHTEAALGAAFRDRLLLTASETAKLLGVDVKTLSRMTDERVIRAVRRGKLRAYTEADIRAYLTEGPDVPCRRPKEKPAVVRSAKVVNFTDRRTRRRDHERLQAPE